MRTRLVKFQLIAFVIVAILGLVYVGAKYVRLDNLLGFGQYNVNARFADSGGIFTNAEVTYRGVPVGRVGDLSLAEDGIVVDLKIDSGAPKIPSSAKAVVANRSAIGEQYVDLQPTSDDGPYLQEGSVIDEQNTSVPTPVENVLASANSLVRSVPLAELTKTINELGTAFDGKGDDLQSLVDSLDTFSQAGVDNLPQTLALIRDSRTVLDTQSDQSSSIRQFSTDLGKITDQLKASDPDVRRIIDNGNLASPEINDLIDKSGGNLTTDLTNLAAVTRTLAPRSIALQPILQFLPALAAGAGTAANGDGTLKQGLILETNNPPPCTQGYEGTAKILADMKRQNPNFDPTVDDFPLNMDANCTTSIGSVTGVRSSNRIAYADPATPQPWDSKPKKAADSLNLNPIATQAATLLGITPKG
ncbi:MCE family protein [Antrihabitans cavernicola]|uniref:MCE family protein n=1 Tax=Antrihabitans cavernicola TaxID=2495913 RepID=A0A5A7S728_9NOCA|nr:MlaD family protein [Spelaeibacter cavernicola]KAA0020210.1 MCE family protein [Spelaeibacter cavernicola]